MINIIMKAIDLSNLVYLERLEDMERILDIEENFMDVTFINNKITDTQVLICEDNERAWVVFRGTEIDSFNDWITNLNCSFVKGPWGDVHKGFYDDVESVRWKIINIIAESIKLNKQIIFTGHSQGAACAELLFSDMCDFLPSQNMICIPIETPRNMSKEAAKAFGDIHGSKIYHVVNNNDIVTRVPTRFMGYAHVKNINMNYLDEDGCLHYDMSPWEMFKDRVKGRVYDFGELGTDGIKDHSIDEVQRIWRKLV